MTYSNPRETNALGWIKVDREDGTSLVLDPDNRDTRLLWQMARNGDFGDVAAYVAPEPTDDELAAEARAKRNAKLVATDWIVLADAPVANKAAWCAYRQALRDIPEQRGFPREIEWPVPPAYAADADQEATNRGN